MKNPFDTITNPTKIQIAILEERKNVLRDYIREKQDQIDIINHEIILLQEKL